jgi:hypothetical protein
MTTSRLGFLKCIALCVLGYQVEGRWAWEWSSNSYEMVDNYDGSNFFDQFRFFTVSFEIISPSMYMIEALKLTTIFVLG